MATRDGPAPLVDAGVVVGDAVVLEEGENLVPDAEDLEATRLYKVIDDNDWINSLGVVVD